MPPPNDSLASSLLQPRRNPAPSSITWLLLTVFLLHAAMIGYDVSHPEVFFNADRAASRFEAIRGFYEAWAIGDAAAFLSSHGIAGDYLLQALVIALAGKSGLITLQISLSVIAGIGVFRLGQLLGLSSRLAALAGAIYLLFPHTLLFSHQLAAEGLYSPLLTIALWLAAEFVVKPRLSLLVAGALLLGLANLIRPITMLWPILVGFVLARASRKKYGLGYLAISALPLLIWMSFIAAQTGSFGLGKSDHDMGHNLYQRAWRISETLPDAEAAAARRTFLDQGRKGSLGVLKYFQFGFHYPLPFLTHAARDAFIFIGKSGIERLPIDYLQINSEARTGMQDAGSGWRAHLEREGVVSTLRLLWQSQGLVLVVSLAGSLLMLAVIAAAIAGGWHLLSGFSRLSAVQGFIAILLICLPLYVLVFSQVVDAVQSRHRAPAEAALVLLAVLGGSRIAARLFNQPPARTGNR